MNNERVFAADFGTTFTEFGFLGGDGRPEIIKNHSGERKLKTAVWFRNGSGKKFGGPAARAASVHPDSVLQEFKPDLDDPDTSFSVDGKKLKPVVVAELFYEHVRDRITETTGEEPKKAVITVPAYFGELGRETLKLGAEKAGFEIERILKEPASAAVGYAINNPLDHKETVLVYDFGGGTFDVSLMEVTEEHGSPRFNIINNLGKTNLGGRDFTEKIVEEIFVEKFVKEHGTDPTDKPEVRAEWLRRAEDIKKNLSESESDVDFLQGEKEQLRIEVTRGEFEELIEPEVEQTMDITRKLLDETEKEKSKIDRLVLVGGTTRIPLIRKKISDFTGLEPEKGVDPDLAVVSGAILVAGAKGNQTIRDKKGIRVPLLASEVRDVTSHAIGIKAINSETNEEYHEIIVPKSAPLRASGTKTFHPEEDEAQKVEITILEGDSENLDQCRTLQEAYELEIGSQKRKEEVNIELTLIVNKHGLIELVAKTEFGDKIHKEFKNPNIVEN